MGCCCSKKSKPVIKTSTVFGDSDIFYQYDTTQKREQNSGKNLDKQVNELLEKWKIDTYASNTFLHKIPEKRILEQRDLIRKKLGHV